MPKKRISAMDSHELRRRIQAERDRLSREVAVLTTYLATGRDVDLEEARAAYQSCCALTQALGKMRALLQEYRERLSLKS